jgi:hypothetical protein
VTVLAEQQREQQHQSSAVVLMIASVVGELPEHLGDPVSSLAGDLGATWL